MQAFTSYRTDFIRCERIFFCFVQPFSAFSSSSFMCGTLSVPRIDFIAEIKFLKRNMTKTNSKSKPTFSCVVFVLSAARAPYPFGLRWDAECNGKLTNITSFMTFPFPLFQCNTFTFYHSMLKWTNGRILTGIWFVLFYECQRR